MAAATEFFLQCRPYPSPTDELHSSDQITVPARRWEMLYGQHEANMGRPLFVRLGEPTSSGVVVGRLRPAVFGAGDDLGDEELLVPLWMWLQLGAPDEGHWLRMKAVDLPDAGSVTLRPRSIATLGELTGDPVESLAEALSGAGGGPSWACLNAGAELPLAGIGVFDVLRVMNLEGQEVPAACILNLDVELELEPALNTPVLRPATPIVREPSPELLVPPVEPAPVAPPAPAPSGRRFGSYPPGFVPFSGTGYRLG